MEVPPVISIIKSKNDTTHDPCEIRHNVQAPLINTIGAILPEVGMYFDEGM